MTSEVWWASIFLQYFYPSEIIKFFIISTLINYYSRSRYQFIIKVQHLTKFCFDAEGGSWIVIYIPELYFNRRLFQTSIWKKRIIKTKKMKGIAQMLYNQSGIINWNTHVCLLAPHSIAVKNLIGSNFVSTHYGFSWVNLQKDLQKTKSGNSTIPYCIWIIETHFNKQNWSADRSSRWKWDHRKLQHTSKDQVFYHQFVNFNITHEQKFKEGWKLKLKMKSSHKFYDDELYNQKILIKNFLFFRLLSFCKDAKAKEILRSWTNFVLY